MKHCLLSLTLALLMAGFCACQKNGPETKPTTFTATKYNGFFVEELSKAYDQLVKDDNMPVAVNVEGIRYNQAQYTTAAILILDKMLKDPDNWEKNDVEITKLSMPASTQWNTNCLDTISLDQLKTIIDKAYAYGNKHSIYPNYITMDSKYTEEDGTQHDNRITMINTAIILARTFNYFKNHNELPEKVCTWESDFLHKTKNCYVGNPLVVETAKTAIGNASTERAKAEAMFNYSRDEWEWQNYSNTLKGSLQVINDKGGNCCDLSHTLISMYRSMGIPARYMHGQCLFSSSVIGHVFVEVYVDGTWYICDPSNNGNTFGHHNWKHMNTFNGRYNELPF